MEISSLQPILKKHNIRLVGVGLGYNSLDGFMESGCWGQNELCVDRKKKLYRALGLGKGGLWSLIGPSVMLATFNSYMRGVGGNGAGDGPQLGGTYVLDKGGSVLLEFQQEKFGDHPTRESILKSLGLEYEIPNLPEVGPAKTDTTQPDSGQLVTK